MERAKGNKSVPPKTSPGVTKQTVLSKEATVEGDLHATVIGTVESQTVEKSDNTSIGHIHEANFTSAEITKLEQHIVQIVGDESLTANRIVEKLEPILKACSKTKRSKIESIITAHFSDQAEIITNNIIDRLVSSLTALKTDNESTESRKSPRDTNRKSHYKDLPRKYSDIQISKNLSNRKPNQSSSYAFATQVFERKEEKTASTRTVFDNDLKNIIIQALGPDTKDAFIEQIARNLRQYVQELVTKKLQVCPAIIKKLITSADVKLTMDIARLSERLVCELVNRFPEIRAKEKKLQHLWQLPEKNKHFVDKKTMSLESVKSALIKNKYTIITQIFTGTGGLGKTSFVVAYARDSLTDYEGIYWIKAERDLQSEFYRLAIHFYNEGWLTKKPDQADEGLHTIIYRILAERLKQVLFIFDNVKDYDSIESYLPSKNYPQNDINTFHCLLTSRCQSWPAIFSKLVVQVYSLSEAESYIKTSLGDNNYIQSYTYKVTDALVQDLATTMGNYPLAIAQAIAQIKMMNYTIEDFIKRFEQYTSQYLSQNNLLDYKGSILSLLESSIELLTDVCPKAIKVLQMCAYLAPDNIPYFLFENELGVDWDNVVINLRNYSLITVMPDKSFSIHRMVQLAIQISQREISQSVYWLETVLSLMDNNLPNLGWESKDRQIIPHVEVAIEHSMKLISNNEHLISVIFKIGQAMYLARRYSSAINYYKKAEQLNIKNPEARLVNRGNLVGPIKLVINYCTLRALIESRNPNKNFIGEQLAKSIKVLSSSCDDDKEKIKIFRRKLLAATYRYAGDYSNIYSANPDKTTVYFSESIRLHNELGERKDKEDYYHALNSFGLYYYCKQDPNPIDNKKNFENALGCFEDALTVLASIEDINFEKASRALPTAYAHIAKSLIKLTALQEKQKQETLLEKVRNNIENAFLQLNFKKVGSDEYSLTIDIEKLDAGKLNRISTVYITYGDYYFTKENYKDALLNYSIACKYKKKSLPEIHDKQHSEMASIYCDISNAYEKLSDLDNARKYWTKANKLYKKGYFSLYGKEKKQLLKKLKPVLFSEAGKLQLDSKTIITDQVNYNQSLTLP